MTYDEHLRRDRGAILSELTRDAIADHGDCELAYALAAYRYEVILGIPADPPTWAEGGLCAGWAQDQGEA